LLALADEQNEQNEHFSFLFVPGKMKLWFDGTKGTKLIFPSLRKSTKSTESTNFIFLLKLAQSENV